MLASPLLQEAFYKNSQQKENCHSKFLIDHHLNKPHVLYSTKISTSRGVVGKKSNKVRTMNVLGDIDKVTNPLKRKMPF